MTSRERPGGSIWLRPERSAVGRPAQWSLMIRRPPRGTLFPYTSLRSRWSPYHYSPRDQKTIFLRLHPRTIGQLLQTHRKRVQPLPPPFKPLAVQHRVDVASANIRNAVALLPRGAKPVGV